MKLTLDTLPMYCEDCGGCLRWKLSVNSGGHPQAKLGGKSGQLVRRYIFTELLGRQVPPGCVVTTTCEDALCLEPSHIIAMKRGRVQKRVYDSGRRVIAAEYAATMRRREAKGLNALTWEKVAEIRAAHAQGLNDYELAARYGVARSTIYQARKGITWRHEAPASSVFAWRPA